MLVSLVINRYTKIPAIINARTIMLRKWEYKIKIMTNENFNSNLISNFFEARTSNVVKAIGSPKMRIILVPGWNSIFLHNKAKV